MSSQKNITLHITEEQRREIILQAMDHGLSLKDYITMLVSKDLSGIKGGNADE